MLGQPMTLKIVRPDKVAGRRRLCQRKSEGETGAREFELTFLNQRKTDGILVSSDKAFRSVDGIAPGESRERGKNEPNEAEQERDRKTHVQNLPMPPSNLPPRSIASSSVSSHSSPSPTERFPSTRVSVTSPTTRSRRGADSGRRRSSLSSSPTRGSEGKFCWRRSEMRACDARSATVGRTGRKERYRRESHGGRSALAAVSFGTLEQEGPTCDWGLVLLYERLSLYKTMEDLKSERAGELRTRGREKGR